MRKASDRPGRAGSLRVRKARGEEGFALLTALLVLVGLTALTTGGLMMSDSERRVAASYESSVQAFYTANTGLEQYLGTQTGTPGSESYSLSRGVADVEATKLLDMDDGRSVWRVTSVGRIDAAGGSSTRTLSKIAVLESKLVNSNAAITSLSGLQKNGNAGTISGMDAATSSQCPGGGSQNVAGVATPVGGYSENGNGGGNGNGNGNGNGGGGSSCSVPDGSPDCLEDDDLASDLGLNWADIYNNGSPVPTPYDENNWPAYDPDAWPVVYASSNLSVNASRSGQGTLIVTGNLTMNGSFSWDGLVLVGGSVTSNGNNNVEGSIVSGLNKTLGMTVSSSDVGNGNKTFQYQSCYLQFAQQSFSYLIEKPGTWSETF